MYDLGLDRLPTDCSNCCFVLYLKGCTLLCLHEANLQSFQFCTNEVGGMKSGRMGLQQAVNALPNAILLLLQNAVLCFA